MLTQLRHQLHRHPELSGAERATAATIHAFIEQNHPADEVLTEVGGTGLVFRYNYPGAGPTVMIRCELDALPIAEPNRFAHRSLREGVSHKCGHDGHMAMVAGVALWLKTANLQRGSVVLFFQAAEETGKGAEAALRETRFLALRPDYVFALHNIPGAPRHQILLTPPAFSATVYSLAIHLEGKEAHAAEPEQGNNPGLAISQLVAAFAALKVADPAREDFAILTPVYLTLGQKAYGISPGTGALHYTIRTWSESQMETLRTALTTTCGKICAAEQVAWKMDWFEYFPGTINDPNCREIVLAAARKGGRKVREMSHGFRFGEDFGWLSRRYPAAMFGLGAGADCPALHDSTYDFPDEILETGVTMFAEVLQQLLAPASGAIP